MKFYSILLSLLSISGSVFSQNTKGDYVWVLGTHSSNIYNPGDTTGFMFDFNPKPLSVFPNYRTMHMDKDNASLCDSLGNLILYTNGCYLADINHQIIKNGEELGAPYIFLDCDVGDLRDESLKDKSILILPLSNGRIKLIQRMFEVKTPPDTSFSSIIDRYLLTSDLIKNGDNQWEVINKNKLLNKNDSMYEGTLKAVRHANKQDWWVTTFGVYDRDIIKYRVTDTSIIGPMKQDMGVPLYYGGESTGQSTYSPRGNYYAHFDRENGLRLYRFNRTTGWFSDLQFFTVPSSSSSGVAFSPNERFLYVSTLTEIFQYDLEAQGIGNSVRKVAHLEGFIDPRNGTKPNFGNMQLGPDCRIYINSRYTNPHYFSVIAKPDRLGYDCEVLQHSIKTPTDNFNTIPNFPIFRADEPWPCDSSTTVGTPGIFEIPLTLSPNPVSDELQIGYDLRGDYQHSVAEVWDMQGRLMVRQSLDSYRNRTSPSTRDWLPGIYAVRIVQYGRVLAWDKVVKQ